MVVTVIAMRVMQMAVDEIIDVIAVRHRFVAAPGSVNVAWLVACAVGSTLIRILCAHLEPVFVHVISMGMVQVTIVQIVDVIAVLNRSVSAVRTVLMVMMGMMRFVAGAHSGGPRFKWQWTRDVGFAACPQWGTVNPARGKRSFLRMAKRTLIVSI